MISLVGSPQFSQAILGDRNEVPPSGWIHRAPHRSRDLIVWGRRGTQILLAARCADCGGNGDFLTADHERISCVACDGQGWFGIDPRMPSLTQPGSTEKIAVLATRYASGIPLWHVGDRPDI